MKYKLRLFLLSTLLLFSIVVMGGSWLLRQPSVQETIIHWILNRISVDLPYSLEYKQCQYHFPCTLIFEDLSLHHPSIGKMMIHQGECSIKARSFYPWSTSLLVWDAHHLHCEPALLKEPIDIEHLCGSLQYSKQAYKWVISIEKGGNVLSIEGALSSTWNGEGTITHSQFGTLAWNLQKDDTMLVIQTDHLQPGLCSASMFIGKEKIEGIGHILGHTGSFSAPSTLFCKNVQSPLCLTIDQHSYIATLITDGDNRVSLVSEIGSIVWGDKELSITIPALLYRNIRFQEVMFQVSLRDSLFPFTLNTQIAPPSSPPFIFQGSGYVQNNHMLLSGCCYNKEYLDTKITLSIPLDDITAYTVDLSGKGDLSSLASYLEQKNICVVGEFFADLHLHMGATPLLYGSVEMKEGQLHFLSSGISCYHLSAKAWAKGKEISLHTQGMDYKSHPISMEGVITWKLPELPFVLTVHYEEFLSYHSDTISLYCDGSLVLQGDTSHLEIQGRGSLHEGSIHIEKKVFDTKSDITFIFPTIEEPRKERYPITCALTLDIPETLLIKGKGVKSLWNGSLHITYDRSWVFSGKLKLKEGSMQWNDERIDLHYGKIQFFHTSYSKGLCEIIGTLTHPSVTITTRLSGNISDLGLTLESNPPLPQETILSWLLFGADIHEITPKEMLTLTHMLNIGNHGEHPLKKYLGIDLLALTSGHLTLDYGVTVGKYLSDKTWIAVNKSLSGNNDSIVLRGQLLNHLFLEGSCRGKLNEWDFNQGQISLKWNKSY